MTTQLLLYVTSKDAKKLHKIVKRTKKLEFYFFQLFSLVPNSTAQAKNDDIFKLKSTNTSHKIESYDKILYPSTHPHNKPKSQTPNSVISLKNIDYVPALSKQIMTNEGSQRVNSNGESQRDSHSHRGDKNVSVLKKLDYKDLIITTQLEQGKFSKVFLASWINTPVAYKLYKKNTYITPIFPVHKYTVT